MLGGQKYFFICFLHIFLPFKELFKKEIQLFTKMSTTLRLLQRISPNVFLCSAHRPLILVQRCRFYAAQKPQARSQDRSLAESKSDGAVTLSMGEKVKENAKTGGYGLVIIAGVAVTGGLLYVILSELFSGESPNNIYTHAFKLCKLSLEVQDTLGTPIKCYGEETRRGWRRHVSHVEFIQGNIKHLRMKFYIEGPFGKATVHLEKKKAEGGKYEYSYILVDVDYPPRKISVHF